MSGEGSCEAEAAAPREAAAEEDEGGALRRMLAQVPTDACTARDSAEGAFERANAMKRENRMVEALSCYKAALALSPSHASAYNNMANTLKRTHGQLLCGDEPCSADELALAAVHSLRTVISLNPRHANAYANLASSMRSRQRIAECLALNRAALRLEPRHVMAYENYGRALQADSAPMGAANTVDEAEAAGDLDTGEASEGAAASSGNWVYTVQGGVRHSGRLEEAVRAFNSVLTLQGERASLNAWRGAAYSMLWLGRTQEAASTLEAGLAAGVWRTRGQYPGELEHSITSQPFPESSARVDCIPRLLEARGAALAAEAEALLHRSARNESASGHADGGWQPGLFRKEMEGLHTPRDGFAYYDVLAACQFGERRRELPQFCEALNALATQTHAQVELARISRLQAGVSLSAHTGLHNRRWRCHLGLQLAASRTARLWVGGQPQVWEVGKAFVFDDSFEHHVAWDGAVLPVSLAADEARLVFIVDFLHPDLAPAGRPICP